MSEIKRDLISVIIPVYNVEQYLDECVASVVAQTHTNLEIILIDDGSQDESGKICDAWERKDSRIKVIHQENQSVSSARNTGIESATAEYIGFVDPDDMILPEFYENLYYAITEKNADVAITHEVIWNGEKVGEVPSDFRKDKIECLENRDQLMEHFMESFTGRIGWVWNKL